SGFLGPAPSWETRLAGEGVTSPARPGDRSPGVGHPGGSDREGQGVRGVACVGGLGWWVGLRGGPLCKLGERSKAGGDPRDRPARAAGGSRSDPGGRAAADADTSALLAGRIIDSFNQRPQKTYIQVVALREGPEEPAAPVEVEVGPEGYFAVPGLKRGRHYQLIARVRDGDKTVMAGTTYATPPDPRVVIRISEDFVSRETPAAPGDPVLPGGKGTPKDRADARSPAAGLDRPVVPKPGTNTPPGSFAAPPGGPVQLGSPATGGHGGTNQSSVISPAHPE